MKKPIKNYVVIDEKRDESLLANMEEFYMCEYIDAYVKKPLQEEPEDINLVMSIS